jgi:hypothetical protein
MKTINTIQKEIEETRKQHNLAIQLAQNIEIKLIKLQGQLELLQLDNPQKQKNRTPKNPKT